MPFRWLVLVTTTFEKKEKEKRGIDESNSSDSTLKLKY